MIYQLFKRLLVVLFVSLVSYVAFSHAINRSACYVSEVLFSVGMALIIIFNLDVIQHGYGVKRIAFRLDNSINDMAVLIIITTLYLYLSNILTPESENIIKIIKIGKYKIDLFVFSQCFVLTYTIYSFVYFMRTFIELKKLK